jgi:hypothetical protein
MPGFLSSASRYWRRGHFPGGASKINLILDNLYAIGKIKKMMGHRLVSVAIWAGAEGSVKCLSVDVLDVSGE